MRMSCWSRRSFHLWSPTWGAVGVNCHAPLVLAHRFGRRMCLGQRAACRFCLGAVESDDVTAPLDCDQLDDGVANASCP